MREYSSIRSHRPIVDERTNASDSDRSFQIRFLQVSQEATVSLLTRSIKSEPFFRSVGFNNGNLIKLLLVHTIQYRGSRLL